MLREGNAIVDEVAVVVDRNGRAQDIAGRLGVTIHRLFEFSEASGVLTPALGSFAPPPPY
jgi:orotate phosphoribosyltransferase